MERNFWFRLAVVVVALSAIVYLIDALRRFWGFLGDLLVAIFLAWLVGSILLHIVNSLMRIPRMRRSVAIVIVYVALITLVADFAFLVIPATVNQVLDITEVLPGFIQEELPVWSDRVSGILANFGLNIEILGEDQLASLGDLADSAAAWASENAIEIFQNVFSALFLTGLVIVLSFYFVLDGGRRLNEAVKVLPPGAEREVRFIFRTIDETFYGYVRGMLVISMIYGVATSSVMLATGLPAALPAGIISAILLAVPFVGDWLALVLPLLIAFVAGDLVTVIIVFAVLFFVQQVMINLLTPRILGHAVHMPAMIVVVAVVLGARFAGVAGALFGVPMAAVIYTLSVHYGMRIRRAREAREAAELAAADAAVPPRRRTAQQMGTTQPVPAGAAPGSDGADFQEQILEALEEVDEQDGLPRSVTRRVRRAQGPS